MLKKLDYDFFEMLGNPASVEKRLADLASQRLLFGISAAVSALVVFTILLMLLSTIVRFPDQSNQTLISTPVSGCLFMVVGMTTSLARAIGALSEIRTLLVFKKLRDDRSVATP